MQTAVLVTLDTGNIYFVFLNDYIDKYILPNDPNFSEKQTKVIHIPTQNLISKDQLSLVPIRFLSKRAKLYSAFTKFTYQEHEISFLLNQISITPANSLYESPELNTIRHFLNIINRYDFLETTEMWYAVYYAHYSGPRFSDSDLRWCLARKRGL